MRTKQVNRYYCDYCSKASLSASHMARHEKHCTLNLNRVCRVCKFVEDGRSKDFQQSTPAELVALLPVPIVTKTEFDGMKFQDGFEAAVVSAVPKLREAAGNCPACMLAALRQARIPVPIAEGFCYTDEMKELWSNVNEAQFARDRNSYY